jgi:hypothetical protein
MATTPELGFTLLAQGNVFEEDYHNEIANAIDEGFGVAAYDWRQNQLISGLELSTSAGLTLNLNVTAGSAIIWRRGQQEVVSAGTTLTLADDSDIYIFYDSARAGNKFYSQSTSVAAGTSDALIGHVTTASGAISTIRPATLCPAGFTLLKNTSGVTATFGQVALASLTDPKAFTVGAINNSSRGRGIVAHETANNQWGPVAYSGDGFMVVSGVVAVGDLLTSGPIFGAGTSNSSPGNGATIAKALQAKTGAGTGLIKVLLAGGGGGGTSVTVADTVVTETNFGQAATAGVAATVSRSDHSHGSPGFPYGNSIVAANSYGQSAIVGSSTFVSKVDHSHGSPNPPTLAVCTGRITLGQMAAGTANYLLTGQGTSSDPAYTLYDHHNLSGLSDDDHAQYLRADGLRTLTGNLPVDNGITIDGVDLSVLNTNFTSHSAGTANPHFTTYDQISAADGDTNVTAAELEELTDGSSTTLHTHGFSDHGALSGLTDDDHGQYLLAAGTSRNLIGNLGVLSGVQIDGVDISALNTDFLSHSAGTSNPHVTTYDQISAADASTDVTGAELEALTDGSVTGLHSHVGIGTATASPTVVEATSFGMSSVLGSSGTFSDGDHSHGTPSLPAINTLSGQISTAQHGSLSSPESDHTGTLSGTARVIVQAEGSVVAGRRAVNFIAGTGIAATVADAAGDERVNVTLAGKQNFESVGYWSGVPTATSANIKQLTDGSETTLHSHAGGDLTGALLANGSVTGTSQTFVSVGTGQIPLTVKGVGGQTNCLQQWQDVNGNVLACVSGSAITTPRMELRLDDADGTISLRITKAGGSGNPNPRLQFYGSRGTVASPAAIQNGEVIAHIQGWSYGATGWSAAPRSAIIFNAAENWTDAAQGTNIQFWTTATSSTTTAANMILDGSGNLNVTGSYKIDNVQVLTNRQADIADFGSTAQTGVDWTCRQKVNDILAMLRVHGLIG